MKIRVMEKSDITEVSRLIRRAVLRSNSADYTPSQVRYICQRFTPNHLRKDVRNGVTLVGIIGSNIVGTAGLHNNRIRRVFVHHLRQNRGIGNKLIQRIEKLALEKNIHLLKLRSSITAIKFYEKLGYRAKRRVFSKTQGQMLWMEKEL